MDNASNNNTCMDSFSRGLYPRISFDPIDRRIRWVDIWLVKQWFWFNCIIQLFSAYCKPCMSSRHHEITNVKLADINADDYDPDNSLPTLDSIALLRTTIRKVCFFLSIFNWISLISCLLKIRSSSLRRESFSKTCQRLHLADNQLLLDITTRWSSTYIMIQHAVALQPVWVLIIPSKWNFTDLRLGNRRLSW